MKPLDQQDALFITLEGGEGAGKSTQVPRIQAWLEHHGNPVVSTRQPGGTPLSEQIRSLLLDAANQNILPLTELLLLFADRAQFMGEVIRPALAAGKTVLCDRFTDSTFAYQGGGRGLDSNTIEALASLVHDDCQPDLTLLFDLPPEQGLMRAGKRGATNRLEHEAAEFYLRVREAYLQRARNEPERFAVIDASLSPEAVWVQIEEHLDQRIRA